MSTLVLLTLLADAAAPVAIAEPTRSVAAGKLLGGRVRCSSKPEVAAQYIIPPPPFKARVVSVRRWQMPPGEPLGRGAQFKRLYRVTFQVLKGNPVLPAGHRYSQFAYVTRKRMTAPWCFLKGGSGP